MRPLSEATAKIAGRSFQRKYIALGRIVKNWEDIVGAKLAHKAQPVKIMYRKGKNGAKPTATLEIAASSADATLLHYQKDLILERINQIFGEQWVSAIRFVNTPSNSQPPIKMQKFKKPLSESENKALSHSVLDIEDEDMKSRLLKLGQSIFTDKKT